MRSDIYSVGAVGYFLLTGRPVFEGRSVGEILLKQVGELPQSPSARCGRAISGELETILLRCLAKDPAHRPESATALAKALSGIPVSPWTMADAATWWQANAPAGPARQGPDTVAETAPTVDVAEAR